MSLIQTIRNSGAELIVLVVMLVVQDFLFDELPEPLNQVQIGGVGWQEDKPNLKPLRFLQNQLALSLSGSTTLKQMTKLRK
jgi:hypothetical protein